jgi:hypothetical protein
MPMSAPVLGYAFDPTAGLRPILGIPGAAQLGDPVLFEAALAGAVVSPRQDYAVAWVGDDRVATLVDVRLATARELAGARNGADRIVVSPSGEAAALIDTKALRAQVFKGLPSSPELAAEFDLL